MYEKTVTLGGMWSGKIGKGRTLRLTDIEGGVNVGMLLYNADQPLERYNMPDTLKGQHTFHLRHPFCLHSDMGRIIASITKDSVGWHDTVSGCTNSDTIENQYGTQSYQDARNDFHRNGYDSFLIELGKWGLGERDIIPNLNLFSKVVAGADGKLSYVENHSQAGDLVELRFEMNTIVILNTCPHPLDPSDQYTPRPVKLEVFESPLPAADDPCRISRPENERAFLNTENYYHLHS